MSEPYNPLDDDRIPEPTPRYERLREKYRPSLPDKRFDNPEPGAAWDVIGLIGWIAISVVLAFALGFFLRTC